MFGHVNRDLLPIKAHYFLYNAATGPMMQFLPTIARQLGFSGKLVGTIYTILPISGLIAKPLFGGLADKFRLHKAFFLAFQAILAIAFFTINFIPETEPSASGKLICNGLSFLELNFSQTLSDDDIPGNAQNSTKHQSTCHLSCTPNTVHSVKAICNSWNVQKYCTLVAAGISNEKVKSLSKMEFDAQFYDYYDMKLKNVLNIRVENAFFEDEIVHKAICSEPANFKIPCRVWCPKVPSIDKLIRNISINERAQNTNLSAWNFQWFLWASIVSWIGMAVVVSIGDAICFDLLRSGKSRDYGRQKMWGSIGVGIFGIGVGYLIDLLSKGDEIKDYTCIFYIMLAAMSFDMLISSTLKKSSLDNISEPSVFYELWSILKEARVLVFAWWCIGAGMCTGVIWNFLFWYTEDISTEPSQKEWLKTLQGLLTGVQCFLGEMPFNFISDTILRKIGHINVMSLVLLVYAIRFMAYSMFTNPWIFLLLEILHGPSLGLCWPTMVSYGDKVAPSGTKATIQGLVGAVFEGIGVSLGSLICGFLIDEYKGVITFRVFSVGALVWLSVFWILQLVLREVKAYPLQQGHTHLASYTLPDDDAILMTMSQEMQTY